MISISPDRIEVLDQLRAIVEQQPVGVVHPALWAVMNRHCLVLPRVYEAENYSDEKWTVAADAEMKALDTLVKARCGSHAAYVWKMDYLSLYSAAHDWGDNVANACVDATNAYREEREIHAAA
jgi:hypothetical protein